MDNNDIFLLFIGSGLSLFGAIVFALLTRIVSHVGKISIFIKFVYSKMKDRTCLQVINTTDGKSLQAPVWLELVNTKNVPYLFRNVQLSIFHNDTYICSMKQINKIELKNSNGYESSVFGDEGNYTFLLPPISVKKFDLYFNIKSSQCQGTHFNNIRLSYFDINDRLHNIKVHEFESGWESTEHYHDDDWVKIK